jgi:hypothetical protein
MADGDNPRTPVEEPVRAGPDWLEARSHRAAPRTRIVIGLALAASAAAVAIHVTSAPSVRPSPGRHGPSQVVVPSDEPLLDHCAVRVPRSERVRCLNAADSSP